MIMAYILFFIGLAGCITGFIEITKNNVFAGVLLMIVSGMILWYSGGMFGN